MQPELRAAADSSGLPEPSGPADLEARLAAAAARARATRAVGGTLSPRTARDLRARLVAAASTAQPAAEPGVVEAAADTAAGAGRPSIRVERRRWPREAAATPEPTPAVTVPVVPTPARPRAGRTRFWRSVLRLVAVLVVAAVVVGATAYASGRLQVPSVLSASVVEAAGATATRVGVPIQLAAGTPLQAGDTVTVSSSGAAVLDLGQSLVRLAGGSAVHLDRVDAAGVTVGQLAGRVYYRVLSAGHAPFVVTTGPVTWTATGTAFDAAREPVAAGQGAGQERITLLAVQDAVTASGPGFDTTVPQGDRAIVYIGAATPVVAPALDAVPAAALFDQWLQANGAADLAAGLPLGILEGRLQAALASPTGSPSPTPFVTPSPFPTDTPFPTALDSPTPTPTAAATPVVTPRLTPGPTASPTPGIGTLALTATSCPGGVVLDWSGYTGKGAFVRYVTLRSPNGGPPVVYPPGDPSVTQVAGTTSKGALSGFDAQAAGPGSAYWYRTLALASGGKVLAASPARGRAGGAGGVATIADFTVTKDPYDAMKTDLSWTAFSGPSACFTEYRFTAGSWSYTLRTAASTSGAEGMLVTCGAQSFQIEAIRETALGQLVVARSAPTPCG